jgi:serine/threonine-protein kinase RsbW
MNKTSWPASLDSIPRIREHVETAAEELGIDKKTASQLGLAIEEITVNIVKYAYNDNSGEHIEIAIEKGSLQVAVYITDHGVPFNPTKTLKPDTQSPLLDRQVGGLGLFLVRNLVDDINYERIGSQNHLVITKSL